MRCVLGWFVFTRLVVGGWGGDEEIDLVLRLRDLVLRMCGCEFEIILIGEMMVLLGLHWYDFSIGL